MHVVISGYYGFENIGDEAILYSIIQAMRNLQPEIEFTVLSNNPESTKKKYDVHAVNRWKFKEVNRVIKRSDGLISGGGSLLQDKTGLKTIPYYLGVIELARWHRKPVFIYAQGIGPVSQSLNKIFIRKTLNKVDQITIRDNISKTFLEKIGVSSSITVVPDPVLGLDAKSLENDWINSQHISEGFIAVSVRDWPTTKPYKEKIAKCLDQLVHAGHSIVFVPMCGEQDRITSLETADLMKEKSNVAPADVSIEEAISIIGQSRLLIGMRLHSLIFSTLTYTPFIAISYDPKIDAFASIFEQPIVGHVNKDDWNEAKLLNAVNQAIAEEVTQQSKIQNKMINIQHEALEIPKLALPLFKS